VRALFVEFPNDPGSWQIDDEYLYGSQMLVAPLLHNGETTRDVYLPPGTWIDYQTGKAYAGGWQKIEAGKIPEIILVRDGSVIPHIALAQSTAQMDWSKIELRIFAKDATTAKGLIFLPGDSELHELTLTKENAAAQPNPSWWRALFGSRSSPIKNENGAFKLASDPSAGKVTWQISSEAK
jgi:alpha-D-xyloside xylohydrolase